MPLLEARNVWCHYGEAAVVRDVALDADAGTLTALLGPNGAGKSTLLRALAGIGPFTGEIRIGGTELRRMSRRHVAQQVALVAQDPPADVPFTVMELVLMGRAPYLGRLAFEGPHDRELAEAAMKSADVLQLAGRPINQLSGGERRRVFLARALAQQPKILLLDEPTAFLDLGHQSQVLAHAAELARGGLCVVAVLHDPNLAATYADQAVLLKDGEVVAHGPARETLRADRLSALYGTELLELVGPGGEGPYVAHKPVSS